MDRFPSGAVERDVGCQGIAEALQPKPVIRIIAWTPEFVGQLRFHSGLEAVLNEIDVPACRGSDQVRIVSTVRSQGFPNQEPRLRPWVRIVKALNADANIEVARRLEIKEVKTIGCSTHIAAPSQRLEAGEFEQCRRAGLNWCPNVGSGEVQDGRGAAGRVARKVRKRGEGYFDIRCRLTRKPQKHGPTIGTDRRICDGLSEPGRVISDVGCCRHTQSFAEIQRHSGPVQAECLQHFGRYRVIRHGKCRRIAYPNADFVGHNDTIAAGVERAHCGQCQG